ncbi:unnamed protein product [Withania somnifera]
MGSIAAAYCGGLLCCSQFPSNNSRIVSGLSVLEQDLQGKPGGLRCFGAARQVPQRLYSLDELRLNGIETVSLLSPVDATLGAIERNLQIAAVLSGSAAWFSCIALAGVATEYLLFGYAEGGLTDINQLDALLESLGFTQKKADSQVRWAVLNRVLILRRHEKARAKLAEAMTQGKSVGVCIDTTEKYNSDDDL